MRQNEKTLNMMIEMRVLQKKQNLINKGISRRFFIKNMDYKETATKENFVEQA